MIQKDYLLRVIEQVVAAIMEQLVAVIAKIAVHKEAENYDQALTEVDLAYKTLLQFDPNQIRKMTEDEIIHLLSTGGNFDAEKSLVIAELLREEAEIQELEKGFDNTIFSLWIKSFYLYVEAIIHDSRFRQPEYFKKIDALIPKIGQYELPPQTKFKLFQYYEKIGSFDKAEDILYELVAVQYSNIAVEGENFYTRLRDRSDHELSDGNLPRDEIQEGLDQLIELCASAKGS